MTDDQVLAMLEGGVRVRWVPERFADGSTDDPRALYVGAARVASNGSDDPFDALRRLMKAGKVEEREDFENNITEYVVAGGRAVWEEP